MKWQLQQSRKTNMDPKINPGFPTQGILSQSETTEGSRKRKGSPVSDSELSGLQIGKLSMGSKPPRETLEQELGQAISSVGGNLSASDLADSVLQCKNGPLLDLSGFSEQEMGALQRLSQDGWKALEKTTAAEGQPITSITLPEGVSHETAETQQTLCLGLKELSSLDHVTFLVSGSGETRLDVGALEGSALQTVAVLAKGSNSWNSPTDIPDTRLHVRAPVGVHVFGRSNSLPSMHKSFVQYVKDGKNAGPPCTLDGMPYFRQADTKDGTNQLEADKELVHRNLNHLATFKGSGNPIKCRELAMEHLLRREQYHQNRQSGGDTKTTRFSMAHATSPEALSAHMDEEVIEDAMESLKGQLQLLGDDCVFDFSDFENEMIKRSQGMKPGDWKLFGLWTDSHSIDVELQVKTRSSGTRQWTDLVIEIYDPVNTGTQARRTARDSKAFAGRHLSTWVGKNSICFAPAEGDWRTPTSGRLYPWPPVKMEDVLGPQHKLVGHAVELSADEDGALECRAQDLRAVPGGSTENGTEFVLCVSSHHRGIGCLGEFRKTLNTLNATHKVRSQALTGAGRKGDAYYWIPASLLRESPSTPAETTR